MKKAKPVTPYARLLKEIETHLFSVKYRHTVAAYQLPQSRLAEGWEMASVAHGVAAAEKIGYDTIIKLHPGSGDLVIQFVKKVPDAPYAWLPE